MLPTGARERGINVDVHPLPPSVASATPCYHIPVEHDPTLLKIPLNVGFIWSESRFSSLGVYDPPSSLHNAKAAGVSP